MKAWALSPIVEEATQIWPDLAPLLAWSIDAGLYLFGSALLLVLYLDLRSGLRGPLRRRGPRAE